MARVHIIRWGGMAAILAGTLRGIASFVPSSTSVGLQVFYLIIDVLLFVSIMSIHAFQRKQTGWWERAGFWLALFGAGLLIIHDFASADINFYLYPIAALCFAIGISILAVWSWKVKTLPLWVAMCLLIATPVGILGYLIKGFAVLFVISGVLLGIGLIGAGLRLWMGKRGTSTQ